MYADLVWCYKILFGIVDVQSDHLKKKFNIRPSRLCSRRLTKGEIYIEAVKAQCDCRVNVDRDHVQDIVKRAW